jgi:hypothetical protein
MKANFQNNGLSARRKTVDRIRKHVHGVSRHIPILIVMGLMLVSCLKMKEQATAAKGNDTTATWSANVSKPQTDIKVNRRYDDKGNLIGFDSTYTSFYSNAQGDTAQMDSLMRRFDRYFSSQHQRWFDNRFNSLFFRDSTGYPDFFHDDFFTKRYEMNDLYFKDMMHRMDSVKNNFYRHQTQKQPLSNNHK